MKVLIALAGPVSRQTALIAPVLLLCGVLASCSTESRKVAPPDSGDTESDTGTQPGWSAPGWELAWVVQAGGQENILAHSGDMGFFLCPAQDGGIFVPGYTYSENALFGEGTGNEISYLPPEEGLIFLARYDGSGTPAWVSRAATAGIGATSCAATEDGGAVAGGVLDVQAPYGSFVFGAGEPGERELDLACDRSLFVAKYSGDGSFQWITAADGEGGYGHGGVVTVAPDGDICLAGEVFEPFAFQAGEGSVTVQGTDIDGSATTANGFLARFSTDGTPLWARELNGTDWNVCDAAIAMEDGSCAVACSHCGLSFLRGGSSPDAVFELQEEEDEEGIPAECGALVARYSAEGDLLWATDLGARGEGLSTRAGGLAVGPNGSLAAGGSFNGTIETAQGILQAEGADLFLSRLSPEGEILWTAVAQGPGDSQVHAENVSGLSVSPDGDVAVAGAFSGTKVFGAGEDRETTLVSGAADWFNGFAAMYSPEGSLRWAIPVALGPAVDWSCPNNWGEQCANSIGFSGPDALYITGSFLKDATFGTSPESMVTLQPYGCADMFLMKLERVEEPR